LLRAVGALGRSAEDKHLPLEQPPVSAENAHRSLGVILFTYLAEAASANAGFAPRFTITTWR
jgi:hypothetical protein